MIKNKTILHHRKLQLPSIIFRRNVTNYLKAGSHSLTHRIENIKKGVCSTSLMSQNRENCMKEHIHFETFPNLHYTPAQQNCQVNFFSYIFLPTPLSIKNQIPSI